MGKTAGVWLSSCYNHAVSEDIHFGLERTGAYPGVTMLHALKEVLTASDGDKLPRYLPSCSGLHCGAGCLPVKYCKAGSRLPCNNDGYDLDDDHDNGHHVENKNRGGATFGAGSTGLMGLLVLTRV